MQKYALLSRIAYLYYVEGKNQAEIASELGIYRTSISRYLKQARELGIVSIEIKDFNPDLLHMERQIRDIFSLKQVHIVDVDHTSGNRQKQERFAKGAAEVLKQILKSKMTIGLVWGKTIADMVNQMESKIVLDGKVVPLVGGPGHMDTNYHVNTLVYELSKKLSAQASFINGTVIEESVRTKEAIVASKYFEDIQKAWKQLDVAITSVGGGINEQSKWHNLLSESDIEELKMSDVAGDCCGRFFDRSGKVLKTNIDRRTIGLSLEELASVPNAVLLVSSNQKVSPTLSLLKGGYIDTLIIDSDSARECLRRS